MFMKIQKYNSITLLLLMLTMGVYVCVQSAAEPSTETNGINGRLKQLMSLLMTTDETGQKRSLPSNQFGRKNPFMPLMAENMDGIAAYNHSIMPEPDSRGSREEPSIRLTAVFIVTSARGAKNTATIEENGVSRSVSIGDTIAGMEVMEIRRGEVILSSETKKHTMTIVTPLNTILPVRAHLRRERTPVE